MPYRCTNGPWIDNREPSLDEMLADPIVRLAMDSCGASEAEIRQLAGEAQNRRVAGLEVAMKRPFEAPALSRSDSYKLR